MKIIPLLFLACLLACALAQAQSNYNNTAAPGSSLPGVGGIAVGLNGPGYIEVGGSHSSLSSGNEDWNDFYAHAMLSGGRNVFNGELTRQARFGDSGWFGGLGVTRTISENWYAQISAGGSAGGFFLPKFRTDGLINRKLLPKRQLVLSAGLGFDQSKTVNHDERFQLGGMYYFAHPFVLQAGVTWTHANPGNILARTQFFALNEGHEKEHYFSLRYGWGREGYEIIGGPTSFTPAYNVLFDFPVHDISGTWRQWIGPNWGVNFNVEHHQEPAYHRFGGTAGVFLDF
jgi:YaiO family outer membrane protein